MVAVPAIASVSGLINATVEPAGNGAENVRAIVTPTPPAAVTVAIHGAEIASASSHVRRTMLLVKTFAPRAKLVWMPSALVLIRRVEPGFGITCTRSAVAPLVRPKYSPI